MLLIVMSNSLLKSLQAISGVLSNAWCPKGIPKPMDLLDFLKFLSFGNTTGNSTNLIVSGSFVEYYFDDLQVPNRTVPPQILVSSYVDTNNKYCDSMFQSIYYEICYIGMFIFLSMLLFISNI